MNKATSLSSIIKLTIVFLIATCFCVKAQNTSTAANSKAPIHSEEFRHHAQHLYDWRAIENAVAKYLKIDVAACNSFFRYAYRNDMLDYTDYLNKVKNGSITTKEQALRYWTDLFPTFKKVYMQAQAALKNQQPLPSPSPGLLNRASCNNLDFGAGNTSAWKGAWCKDGVEYINYGYDATSLPTTGFNSSPTNNQPFFVHEIMTPGTDPYAPIQKVPAGHNYSLRLGSDESVGGRPFPYNHQMVSNTFTVSAANPTITYMYAIVFENKIDAIVGGHKKNEQPYFKIRMFDQNGKEISCASYDVDATEGISSGFQTVNVAGRMIVYKDWVPIYIPLVNYIGQQITIQFESSDCDAGGHFGYAYLAVDCNPFQVITTSPYICGNENIVLTAPPGANSYLWTGPGVPAAPADKAQIITVNAPGKYTVEMTVVGNGGITCTFKLDTTIAGNVKLPVAVFSAPTVCLGQPTVFTDQSTPPGTITSWSWDFNNDGVEDSKLQNPNYTYTTNGTFAVKLKIQLGPCKAEVVQNVIVGPPPVLAITNPPSVCAPLTVDITLPAVTAGSTNTGALSYWMDAAATIPLTSPAAVTATGTYYIKSGTGTCSDIEPVTVTINQVPVSNAGPDVSFCTGESAVLGTAPLADHSYLWSLAGGGAATGLSSNTAANPTVTLSNTGITSSTTVYMVKTINTLTGCTSNDTVNVTVNAIPTANAGTAPSVCIGTPVKLNGAIGGSATSATWNGGNGTYNKDNTQLDAIYTPTQAEYDAGTVKLTLITNDPAGTCTFASSDVTLNFYKNPVIDFVVDIPKGCPVHCVKFTDSTKVSPDQITSWQWDFGDGSAKGNTQNPAHCYTKPGYYDVTLTAVSNHGCSNTLTKPKMIQVFTIPVAEFTMSPNPVSLFNPLVKFTNQSSADVVYWHYSFGDGDTLGNTTPSPAHLYPNEKANTYLANLIVKNADGCTATVSHELVTLPEFTFFIPNAFTPDNDGVNDTFYGEGVGIAKYNFWIFDRWGDLIFYTQDLNESWNGKVKNGEEVAQQDVYVWKVKITDIFNKPHSYLGTVTLLK